MRKTIDSTRKCLQLQKPLHCPVSFTKLLGEIIDARQELQLTQKKLEALSGIKQPMIAKIENGNVNPSLDNLLRLLVSMGKTIKVVPI